MITRAKPMGWWPAEKPMPWHLDRIDQDLTRAVDGVNGGTYSPENELILAGAGIATVSLNELAMTGPFAMRQAAARFCWRRLPLPDLTLPTPTVDTIADEYYSEPPFTVLHEIVYLNISSMGYRVPIEGERIKIVHKPHAGAYYLLVEQISGGIIELGPAALPYDCWAEFIYTGPPNHWVVSAHRSV